MGINAARFREDRWPHCYWREPYLHHHFRFATTSNQHNRGRISNVGWQFYCPAPVICNPSVWWPATIQIWALTKYLQRHFEAPLLPFRFHVTRWANDKFTYQRLPVKMCINRVLEVTSKSSLFLLNEEVVGQFHHHTSSYVKVLSDN